MANSFRCPYCGSRSVLSDNNTNDHQRSFYLGGSKYDIIGYRLNGYSCLNEVCREIVMTIELFREAEVHSSMITCGDSFFESTLLPESIAVPQPDYIPAPIVKTYTEACRIRDLSPTASATLSRRCLQGMIRDFWDVKERTLYDEIEAIQEKIPNETWEAIDAIRHLGNIGAHMKLDINLMSDEVHEDEARAMIDLLEMLFEEWYVDRHDKNEKRAALIAKHRGRMGTADEPKATE